MRNTVVSVLALLALLAGTTTASAADSRGAVWLYSSAGYSGQRTHVETMADNRGWCITLPYGARSLANKSRRVVYVYESRRCSGAYRSDDIRPHQRFSKLTFPVRSIRIR